MNTEEVKFFFQNTLKLIDQSEERKGWGDYMIEDGDNRDRRASIRSASAGARIPALANPVRAPEGPENAHLDA